MTTLIVALKVMAQQVSVMVSGPYDSSEVPNDGTRLDLGSLRIPSAPELEVSVEFDQESISPMSVSMILPHSIISLQAFASPKHEDTWPEVRDDVLAELSKHGIDTTVVLGRFGTEIHTVMPSQEADGQTVITPVRFIGVDGDRWFLRIVVSGAGAVDLQAIEEVDELISDVVVHRGDQAMGPGDALRVVLPEGSEGNNE
jgi:hypothetical protein